MTSPHLSRWISEHLGQQSYRLHPLSGGDISQVYRLSLPSGKHYCIKIHPQPPPGFFAAEAAGLTELASAQALRIPAAIDETENLLVLEYIEPGKPSRNFWHQLGEGLARQHKKTKPVFGFSGNNFCGSTPQLNTQTRNGHDFFNQQRLGYQMKLARDKQLIDAADIKGLEHIQHNLQDMIPSQPASLLHGDLWPGNIMADATGNPVLIDPACHYGWREADIAMTTLFGGFEREFYAAYNKAFPMEPGWENRLPIYNLYHILNHVNLFGSGYQPMLRSVLQSSINLY